MCYQVNELFIELMVGLHERTFQNVTKIDHSQTIQQHAMKTIHERKFINNSDIDKIPVQMATSNIHERKFVNINSDMDKIPVQMAGANIHERNFNTFVICLLYSFFFFFLWYFLSF
jgi:hypothetical protein